MAFENRPYDVFVIIAALGVEPWREPMWSPIAAALDPLIAGARGPALVRSSQFIPHGPQQLGREVKFGRMGWNAASRAKWVHPVEGADGGRHFDFAEVWAPGPAQAAREELAPDLFFTLMAPHPAFGEGGPARLVLAVAEDDHQQAGGIADQAAVRIAEAVGAIRRLRCVRPWGHAFGPNAFYKAISDLAFYLYGVRPRGPAHLDALEGDWQAF